MKNKSVQAIIYSIFHFPTKLGEKVIKFLAKLKNIFFKHIFLKNSWLKNKRPRPKSFKQILIKRRLLFIALLIIIFLGPAIYLVSKNPKKIEAGWWDEMWHYRKSVAITNTGTDLSDYQVKITLDTASLITDGKMQTDCDDIRVVDNNGNLLSHWVEEIPSANACNGASTAIWTKLSSIPTTGTTIYVYYGNPSSSNAENGESVFMFFDDFNGSSLNTDKWTLGGDSSSSVTVTNGYIYPDSYGSCPTGDDSWKGPKLTANIDLSLTDNFSFTAYYKMQNTGSNAYLGGISTYLNDDSNEDSDGYYYYLRDSWKDYADTSTVAYSAGNTIYSSGRGSTFDDFEGTLEIRDDGTDSHYHTNGTERGTQQTQPSMTFTYLRHWFARYCSSVAGGWRAALPINRLYAVTIRKNAATTPSIASPGSEEKGTSPIAYWSFDEGHSTTVHNKMEKNGEDGLVSFWKMDEGTGSTADDEMEVNDGTLGTGSSAPTWTTSSKIGNALNFDGSNDYVELPASNTISPGSAVTISAWVKSEASYNSAARVFTLHRGSSSGTGINICINSDKFSSYSHNGTSGAYLDSGVSVDTSWHFITVTNDDTTHKIYIDGVEKNSQSLGFTTGSKEAYIGHYDASSSTYAWKGIIDNVKLYNRVLSASEISAEYQSLHGHMIDMDASSDWVDGAQANPNQKPMGKALDFDGSNDYLTIQDSDNGNLDFSDTDDLTISTWIKKDTADTNDVIVAKRDSVGVGDTGYILQINSSDEIYFEVSDGTDEYSLQSSSTITDTNWHHVVVVFDQSDASSSTIYLDGVEETSITKTGTIGDIGSIVSTEQLAIGAETDAGNPFDGTIDEVKIYDSALSADQVKQQYNRGFGTVMGVGIDTGVGDTGPVGFWKLDEGSAYTAFDSSGHENTGTLGTGSSAPSWTQGKIGKALDFDGNNDYVSVPDNADFDFGTGDFTFSTWINSTNSTDDDYFLDFDGDTDIYFRSLSSGVVRVYIRDISSNYRYRDSTTTVNDGDWHHIAFTWSGSSDTINIYVDGVLNQGSVTSSGTVGSLNAASPLFIGKRSSGNFFTGSLDHIKIYDYARTPEQIHYDMATGSPIAYYSFDEGYGTTIHNQKEKNGEDGLVSWWKMDEGTGTTAGDEMETNDGALGSGGSAPSWSTTAHAGNALSFDGTDDYIEVTGNSTTDLDKLSISLWLNTSFSGDTQGIFSRYDNHGEWSYQIYSDTSGYIKFNIGSDNVWETTLTSVNAINDGTWHHVVVTYNKIRMSIYIDGILNTDGSETRTIGTPSGTGPYIGTCTYDASAALTFDEANNTFSGNLDQIKLYNRAITSSEVAAEYSSIHGHMIDMDADSDWVSGAKPNPNQKPMGKALEFDGTDDYVETGDIDTLSEISLSAWIYYSSSNTLGIVSKRDSTENAGNWTWLKTDANKLSWKLFQGDGDSQSIVSDSSISTNNWNHVLLTFNENDNTAKLYINGQLEKTKTDLTYNLADNAETVKIGWSGQASTYFNGKIDEVKIYNYTLAASQAKVEYNRGKAMVLGVGASESDPNLNSPIGWWKMDEASGYTTFDSSGNGNNGSLGAGGSAPSWTQGKIGKALDFDGTDDLVDFSTFDGSGMGSGTLEAWVKTTVSTTNHRIIEVGITTDRIGLILIPAGTVTLFSSDSSSAEIDITSTTAIDDGNWHHVLGVWDSSGAKIYVDGIQENSVSGDKTNALSATSTGYIGEYVGGGAYHWNGKIDNVKVYDSALTDAQIAWEYNQGKPVAHYSMDEKDGNIVYNQQEKQLGTSDLVSWWKMNAGVGTSAVDNIGGFDGTLGTGNSAPSWTTAGRLGNALDFDGSNDYINIGDKSNLEGMEAITAMAWIKLEGSSASNQRVISKFWDGTDRSWMLYTGSDDTVRFLVATDTNNTNAIAIGSTAPQNEWHHVAGTWDADTDTINIYLDGVGVGSTGQSGSTIRTNTAPVFIGLGYYNNTYSFPFNGKIDDVKIYNRALSEAEIYQEFNSSQGQMIYMDASSDHVSGKFNNALDFDGTNDYLSFSSNKLFDFDGQAEISVCAWAQTDTLTGPDANKRTIVALDQDGTDGVLLRMLGSTAEFYVDQTESGNQQAATKSNAFSVGTWTHLCGTYDGSTIRIYVDGTEGTPNSQSGTINQPESDAWIGGQEAQSRYWSGLIDEVKVYNYTLTSKQIQVDYNNGKAVGFR